MNYGQSMLKETLEYKKQLLETTEIIKRELGETAEAFDTRVETRRLEKQIATGFLTTAHILGGAQGGGVKGASRYILTVWKK